MPLKRRNVGTHFEDTPGTSISEKTHWTCNIYDNSVFFRHVMNFP